MGLFDNLMQKIFHAGAVAEAPQGVQRANAPVAHGGPASNPQAPAAMPPPMTSAAPAGPVDVAAILDKMAASHHEKLDWKHSIVDLMKLVGMDSSLAARKDLASDLHYTGDTNDSAKMNMWLHKEVMRKLAENGGKVPAELLSH